ncbi:hypothetical protein DKX38_015617 [Salix brachista]|uniref:Nudix hydrolase domain-containing protein n=1 Tax=Salix brachista TaxID=2182728 RepID=A0A5N5L5Q4_9ROSI|nr:hypothetical protein DKX38_015617 [Salix brachista]
MDGLPSGYRPNVGVCLINSDNLVFVASRLNVPGAWQMPQVIPHSDLIFLKQQLIHEKCAGIVQLLIISVLALERVLYCDCSDRSQFWFTFGQDLTENILNALNFALLFNKVEGTFWPSISAPIVTFVPNPGYLINAMNITRGAIGLAYLQGGIEDGEEPKSAAIRELMEETGIVSAEIIAEVPNWLTYDFPPAVKAKVNRLWRGEWHGQAQKWFLMRLTKDESEINLASGEADPEFAEWKWASPEEVIEQAVDYKRPTYEEVMRTFRPYLNENGIAAKCKSSKWQARGNRNTKSRKEQNSTPCIPSQNILLHNCFHVFADVRWNSVLENICAGVPILAWLMMAEQPLNARMVEEEIKVWLRVETCNGSVRGFVKWEGLKKMVEELMEGEMGKEVRKNMVDYGELARKAMEMGGGSSWCNLDALVNDLITGAAQGAR